MKCGDVAPGVQLTPRDAVCLGWPRGGTLARPLCLCVSQSLGQSFLSPLIRCAASVLYQSSAYTWVYSELSPLFQFVYPTSIPPGLLLQLHRSWHLVGQSSLFFFISALAVLSPLFLHVNFRINSLILVFKQLKLVILENGYLTDFFTPVT